MQVSNAWLNNLRDNDNEWSEFIDYNSGKIDDQTGKQASTDDVSQDHVDYKTENEDVDCIDNDTDDEWCEETERPSGAMDTLLQEPDMT